MTCLIVIDTFQTTRNTTDAHYGSDYDDIRKLKAMTVDKDVSIILVHHFRKETADNNFDRISGTNGIFGAADGAIALTRSKDAKTAYIEIRGRDQEERRIEVMRNKNTLRWDFVKCDVEPLLTPLDPDIEKIITFINPMNPKWSGTATCLCETLNLLTSPYRIGLKLRCNAERLESNNITFDVGNIRSFDRIRKAVGEIAATLKVNPNYEGLTLEQQSMLKTILEILDRLYGYDSRTLGLRQASHSCTHERSLSGSCPNPQSPPGGDPSC